jgi:hypothetical protein
MKEKEINLLLPFPEALPVFFEDDSGLLTPSETLRLSDKAEESSAARTISTTSG